MNEATRRSTVYFDPDIQEALRRKTASTHSSLSALVNEAVRRAFDEDQEDSAGFEERRTEGTVTYEALLSDLEADGRI